MWSELLQKQPDAPRPTAEEQEAEADHQREMLLKRIAELEQCGVGALHFMWLAVSNNALKQYIALINVIPDNELMFIEGCVSVYLLHFSDLASNQLILQC